MRRALRQTWRGGLQNNFFFCSQRLWRFSGGGCVSWPWIVPGAAHSHQSAGEPQASPQLAALSGVPGTVQGLWLGAPRAPLGGKEGFFGFSERIHRRCDLCDDRRRSAKRQVVGVPACRMCLHVDDSKDGEDGPLWRLRGWLVVSTLQVMTSDRSRRRLGTFRCGHPGSRAQSTFRGDGRHRWFDEGW